MLNSLGQIISLFFKLGLIAFGGPAAHIAMMHKEVVTDKKWLDEQHFLDLVGATALIPGPNSTEMALHCGYHKGGFLGLICAGFAFILPACVLTGGLAYLYVAFAHIPNYENYLIGIKAVVIILILDALKKLWKKAVKTNELVAVAVLVFILSLTPLTEVAALFLATLLGFIYFKSKAKISSLAVEPLSLFLVFSKIGAVLFGSGYVLIAYLQDEIVNQRGWITSAQLADAIAIGQFTPGPVLSTATFVGYLIGQTPAAVMATLGIFLPSFIFVWILNPLIPKMRRSKNFSILLDCVNAGTIGLMAYALIPLSQVSIMNLSGLMTFLICGGVYLKFKEISSVKLVLLGLVLGILVQALVGLV